MSREAAVRGISVYLPEKVLDNAELVRQFGTWTESKIFGKTGTMLAVTTFPAAAAYMGVLAGVA